MLPQFQLLFVSIHHGLSLQDSVDKLKAKGDWCKEHDRGESQCFICHPELEEKFAARYEAKPPSWTHDSGTRQGSSERMT